MQTQIAETAAVPGPRYRPCVLSVVKAEDPAMREARIVVMDEAAFAPLGFVQDKHTNWLLPLLTLGAGAEPVRLRQD